MTEFSPPYSVTPSGFKIPLTFKQGFFLRDATKAAEPSVASLHRLPVFCRTFSAPLGQILYHAQEKSAEFRKLYVSLFPENGIHHSCDVGCIQLSVGIHIAHLRHVNGNRFGITLNSSVLLSARG